MRQMITIVFAVTLVMGGGCVSVPPGPDEEEAHYEIDWPMLLLLGAAFAGAAAEQRQQAYSQPQQPLALPPQEEIYFGDQGERPATARFQELERQYLQPLPHQKRRSLFGR